MNVFPGTCLIVIAVMWPTSVLSWQLHPTALIQQGPAAVQHESDPDLEVAKGYIAKKQLDSALAQAEKMIRAKPNDPTGYNVRGVAFLGKKDFASARKSFEKANSLRSDDVASSVNLAQLDLQEKNLSDARNRYQGLLARNGKYVPAMIGMANVELASRNQKEALAWLEKAKATDPRDVAAAIALGRYHLARKDAAAAVAALADGVQRNPENVELLNLLGRAQAANGQGDASVGTYQRLVTLRPKSPEAYYLLGMAQTNANKVADASAALRKAIQLKPDFAAATIALARVELQAGRHDQALTLAKKLQKASPKSVVGPTLEGDVLMAKARPADAAKAYERALNIQQTGLLAVKLHGAKSKAGRGKEADVDLEKWLKNHPDDVIALTYSALRNSSMGQDKVAIDQFERVLQNRPSDWLVLNNLAALYHRQNDPRAVPTAEQAYKLKPDPHIADTLGWILMERGETARGLELIQKAAVHLPENSEVRYHLAVALAKSGDKAKSRAELQALLQGNKKFPQREAAEALLKQL